MIPPISAWAKKFFHPRPSNRRRARATDWPSYAPAEVLEARTLLSVTLGSLQVTDLPTTKTEFVALPVSNTTGSVSFNVTSSNPNVTASIVNGGRSLDLNVSGVDSSNVAFNGDLIFRLFESDAPTTTARIIQLVNSGFYKGLTFHRVIQNFVAQGGDPNGNGTGGSGTKFNDEFNTELTFTSNGLLAMANSGDDTNDSQFFITALDQSLAQLPQSLNFNYNIFGILTNGFDTFRKLIGTPTDANDKPLTSAVINSAAVFNDQQNGVLKLSSAAGFTGSSTITVTADDGSGTSQQPFSLNVVPDTVNDPAFLGSVSNQVTNQGTPVTFTVQGIDLENDPLTFVVKDPTSFAGSDSTGSAPANVGVSIKVTGAQGGAPSFATITLTPLGTFSGVANLTVGVRDQTNRGGSTLNSRLNFDTQQITLTVNPVNHAPTTPGGSTSTPTNQPVSIQLTGDDGDPDKTQTLSFELVTQPQHGLISGFNGTNGTMQYNPTAGFTGTDSFTYRVHDNGGTSNGGQDTSAIATFTIHVGAPTISGLALAASSDDGVFNDDNVILNSTPKFVVSAPAGSTVTFLVNGTSTVAATETSPGQFSGTLTRQMLKVGANSLTATATQSGASSSPTAPVSFIYAPPDDSVYTVPGAFGSSQQITFNWSSRNAAFNNEIGVFTVDDASGTVNGIAPGAAGYAAAALGSPSRQVLFASGQGTGATKTITVSGGSLLAFYLVTNNTTANLLQFNSQNAVTGLNGFFSVAAANPDHFDHLRTVADTQTGWMVMNWEDMLFGGDRDFNDAVITILPQATPSPAAGAQVRLPGGPAHDVPVTVTLAPTQRGPGSTAGPVPATAQGEIGMFVASDSAGTVNGIAPGSAGYLQAVMNSSTRQVLFNTGDPLNSQKTLQAPGGSIVGFYYIAGGTAASVLANNPSNSPGSSPVAVFSFDAANPDAANHFRWFGPEFAAAPAAPASGPQPLDLHILGKLFAGPQDFDDYLLEIKLPE